MLFWQEIRRAASRAACTAGNNSATKIPMMAMTTSSLPQLNVRVEPFEFYPGIVG